MCRVHCRDTKMFPVVPRYAMASYIGVPVGIVRHNKLLKAQKHLIPLNPFFLDTLYVAIFHWFLTQKLHLKGKKQVFCLEGTQVKLQGV